MAISTTSINQFQGKKAVKVVVVGGKEPLFRLAQNHIKDRTNIEVIGHINSSRWSLEKSWEDADLFWVLRDHIGTVQKENFLDWARSHNRPYFMAQRKFSLNVGPLLNMGIRLKAVRGRDPELPAPKPRDIVEVPVQGLQPYVRAVVAPTPPPETIDQLAFRVKVLEKLGSLAQAALGHNLSVQIFITNGEITVKFLDG